MGHVLACETQEDIRTLLEEQLARGVVLLPMTGPAQDVDTIVDFEIRYADKPAVRSKGRIVQVLQQGYNGKPGLIVEVEGAALASQLKALL